MTQADRTAPEPQERAELEAIGDFLLSLIQAFLRTGYYTPDHPESRKAKSGLHEKFLSLVGDGGELNLILKGEGKDAVVFVEGLADRPLRLADTMLRGMADTYNPRFVTFMERKELVSLSLKSQMGSEEFSLFVDLMSEPFLDDMREHAAKEKFLACLRERGIVNLSFVFNEDFISARRNLPWRAALALSRLRKDISLVPIFRNLKKEALAEVRREILSDIMRPLGHPELVYAFLMNLDLAGTAELPEQEAEDMVMVLTGEEVLLGLVPLYIGDASGSANRYRDAVPREKFTRILAKICTRLSAMDRREARVLIEEMFTSGLLGVNDLSPEMRERIMTLQLANSFLQKHDQYLKHLDSPAPADEYARRARHLARIVPVLMDKGKAAEAMLILGKLTGHAREESERGRSAAVVLSWMGEGELLPETRRLFLAADKEERVFLGRIFSLMGRWSPPHLLAVIRETNDPWKRKQAVELLAALGPEAAASLIDELRGGGVPAEAEGVVLRALAQSVPASLQREAAEVMRARALSDDKDVRREALVGFCRLGSRGEFDFLRSRLDEPDPKARRAVVRGLGLSGDARALDILARLLAREKEAALAGEEGGAAGVAALEALGHLLESCPAVAPRVATLLLETAREACPKGGWKKLVSRGRALPDSWLPALAEALWKTGSEEGRAILARLAEGEGEAARRASELLKKPAPSRTKPAETG